MSAITEIWHTIQSIVTAADWITLAIAAVVIIGAAFAVEGLDALLGATVVSLIAFGLLGYVRAITLGHQDASAQATAQWHSFLGLPMLTLLAYAIIFAVLIALVNRIRAAIN